MWFKGIVRFTYLKIVKMIQNIWLRIFLDLYKYVCTNIFPIIKNFYAFSFMYIDRKNWLPILISLLI